LLRVAHPVERGNRAQPRAGRPRSREEERDCPDSGEKESETPSIPLEERRRGDRQDERADEDGRKPVRPRRGARPRDPRPEAGSPDATKTAAPKSAPDSEIPSCLRKRRMPQAPIAK